MSAWFIAADIAKLIYADHQDKQENAAMMSAFARILRENNADLLDEMSTLVNRAFSSQKLTECDNRLQALEIFYSEYGNNPQDFDKLKVIERESQFILAILDDADMRLPGILTYVAAASLRINALMLKADIQSGEKQNAIDLANRCKEHVDDMIPLLIDGAKSRIRAKEINSQAFTLGGNKWTCNAGASYLLDGRKKSVGIYYDTYKPSYGQNGDAICTSRSRSSLEGKLDAAYADEEKRLIENLPLKEIKEAVSEWNALAG